jgi:hypothetical protein
MNNNSSLENIIKYLEQLKSNSVVIEEDKKQNIEKWLKNINTDINETLTVYNLLNNIQYNTQLNNIYFTELFKKVNNKLDYENNHLAIKFCQNDIPTKIKDLTKTELNSLKKILEKSNFGCQEKSNNKKKEIDEYENRGFFSKFLNQNGGGDNNTNKIKKNIIRLYNCYVLSLNQNGGAIIHNDLPFLIKQKIEKKIAELIVYNNEHK